MMKLYLLRHGLAVDADEADLKDEDRPLTPEGREKTIQAARGMRRLELGIDLILTSPLPRAMETAALTARTLGCADRVQREELLRPGAQPAQFVQALKKAGSNHRNVMLVGHNPDLERFLGWLITPSAGATVEVKKGGLAVIAFADEITLPERRGSGCLLALYPPKALRRMAG